MPHGLRGIGLAKCGLVGGDELLAQAIGQRLQDRTRSGAGDPVENGVLPLQHVEVGRLPRVDGPAEVAEQVEVRLGVRAAVGVQPFGVRAVRRLRRDLVQQPVARRVVVARHLQRESAARSDELGEAPDHGELVRDPLEQRVRDDQVDRLGRRPGRDVGELVRCAVVRIVSEGLVDHVRRGVDAVDRRLRPARAQHRGEVARSAAEVDDRGGLALHASDEVDERAGAVVGELQIARGVPGRHDSDRTTDLS